MARLEGKAALVTGAGRGVGRAIAQRFADEGARVAVVSRTRATVDRAVQEIVADGGDALGVVCDVGDPDQVDAAVAQVADRFGWIDILVNNAHDTETMTAATVELGRDQLLRQMDTGPIAALRFMQACHPHLARPGGRVINLVSGSGLRCAPGFLPYNMAKEALRALTRTAAREWAAEGITVNALCPMARTDALDAAIQAGTVAPEPWTPIPRWGSAHDDIAPAALFLASEDSRFVTGYTLVADGGDMIDAAR